MKKYLLTLLSGIAFMTVATQPVSAAWYEVTGASPVLKSEVDARQRAMEDALYQATTFSGADLGSLKDLYPYLKDIKRDYRFSGNEIRHIEVLKQEISRGVFYLRARIDIYPAANGCHISQYRKGVLLSRFDIVSPQQASLGSIYQFGDDFTVLLKRQLETGAQSFVVTGITDVNVNPGQPQEATMVAEDNDAQFIVTGEITDLSATLEQRTLGKDQVNRQLAIVINVIDGRTGDVVYTHNYRDIALWPFDRFSQVDTMTARFWQSPYGDMARRMSRTILLDLESALSCRATYPSIINIRGQSAEINVGRIHGAKQGDELQLWHSSSFVDQNGIPRSRLVKSDMNLRVTRVYDTTSEVLVEQPELANSIQIGDLVTKQLKKK